MRHICFSRVCMTTLIGVMVLSIGLVLMTKSAQGAPPSTIANSNTSSMTSWDKNLPSASRFTVLADFNNQAVRDNNTGLVWEQAPDGTTFRSWEAALDYCANKGVGSPTFTPGWRLPSVFELNSVRDYSLGPPYVPALFSDVQANNYWSATTVASNPDAAWDVRFSNGLVSRSDKGGNLLAWCVRGAMNADAY